MTSIEKTLKSIGKYLASNSSFCDLMREMRDKWERTAWKDVTFSFEIERSTFHGSSFGRIIWVCKDKDGNRISLNGEHQDRKLIDLNVTVCKDGDEYRAIMRPGGSCKIADVVTYSHISIGHRECAYRDLLLSQI